MRQKEVSFMALGTVNKIQVRYLDQDEDMIGDVLDMIVERVTKISENCNFYDEHSEVGYYSKRQRVFIKDEWFI